MDSGCWIVERDEIFDFEHVSRRKCASQGAFSLPVRSSDLRRKPSPSIVLTHDERAEPTKITPMLFDDEPTVREREPAGLTAFFARFLPR